MVYQNTNFKICLSLFGCEVKILPKQHIVVQPPNTPNKKEYLIQSLYFTWLLLGSFRGSDRCLREMIFSTETLPLTDFFTSIWLKALNFDDWWLAISQSEKEGEGDHWRWQHASVDQEGRDIPSEKESLPLVRAIVSTVCRVPFNKQRERERHISSQTNITTFICKTQR